MIALWTGIVTIVVTVATLLVILLYLPITLKHALYRRRFKRQLFKHIPLATTYLNSTSDAIIIRHIDSMRETPEEYATRIAGYITNNAEGRLVKFILNCQEEFNVKFISKDEADQMFAKGTDGYKVLQYIQNTGRGEERTETLYTVYVPWIEKAINPWMKLEICKPVLLTFIAGGVELHATVWYSFISPIERTGHTYIVKNAS